MGCMDKEGSQTQQVHLADPKYGSVWLVILVSFLLKSSQFWCGERHPKLSPPAPTAREVHMGASVVEAFLCASLRSGSQDLSRSPGTSQGGCEIGQSDVRLLPPLGTIGWHAAHAPFGGMSHPQAEASVVAAGAATTALEDCENTGGRPAPSVVCGLVFISFPCLMMVWTLCRGLGEKLGMPVLDRALLSSVLVCVMACADGYKWHGDAAPRVCLHAVPCLLSTWTDLCASEPLLPPEHRLDT